MFTHNARFILAGQDSSFRVSSEQTEESVPFESLVNEGPGTLLIETGVSANFTSLDDLTWRKDKVVSLIEKSGLVRPGRFSIAVQQDEAGNFIGYLVIILGLTKREARKILELTVLFGTYYSTRSRYWHRFNSNPPLDDYVRVPLFAVTHDGSDELTLPAAALAPDASTLKPEELFNGRRGDGLYTRGLIGLKQRELEVLDDEGNSWRSAFETHQASKLFYLAVSFGAGQIIRGRIAEAFENEGFGPSDYLRLCEALNGTPLSNHQANIFKSSNRFGGGKEGEEWILRPSEFRVFPRLAASGLTPIEAAGLILDNLRSVENQESLVNR